jgi:hypothetical protein
MTNHNAAITDADRILAEYGLGPVVVAASKISTAPLTTQYEPHAIAACWPPIEEDCFAVLCASIKEHGLLLPITLHDNKVLDGCNRLRACCEIGIAPKFTVYTGSDPLGFALAANETRRHLDASQRSMVAAKLAQLPRGANQHASRDASSEISQTEAADLMHVGRAQVQRARVVQERAVPELVAVVDRGLISVAAAARLAEESVEDQQAIAALVSDGSSATAAIREVTGTVRNAPVASGVDGDQNRTESESASALEQVYLAYRALALADQDRHFRRLKTERAKADAIRAAAAEAQEEAIFREKVARANAQSAKTWASPATVSSEEPTSSP